VAGHEDESQTEAPSQRRLARAWEEGRVPLGRDVALVAGLAAGAAAALALAGVLRAGLVEAVRAALAALPGTPFAALPRLSAAPAAAAAAVCAAAALGGALATLVQTRGGFWPDHPLPDLERLLDPGRLGRLLSRQLLADLALAIVKVVALGWAAWSVVRGEFLTLPAQLGAGPADQLARAFAIAARAGGRMLLVAALLAGADVALVRLRFMKSMRTSRDEAKREAREEEGDPRLRTRRRSRHRELSRGRARVEVPRADALVVNPTHVAVALRYRRDEGRAPRVIAKGKGALADYMRALAREHAVPIVRDVALARLLHRKVKVGREVPAATYKAVAAVLAFVYRLTGRAPGGREASP
jgi:flagellar biosynthesis protein FlhB